MADEKKQEQEEARKEPQKATQPGGTQPAKPTQANPDRDKAEQQSYAERIEDKTSKH